MSAEILSAQIRELAAEYATDGISPEAVNNGYCADFATVVWERLSEKLPDLKIEGHYEGCAGHTWLEYGGRVFDVERPNGVADMRDLPIWRRGEGGPPKPELLYHCTHVSSMMQIVEDGHFEPQGDDRFNSFSEHPYTGDITGNEVIMILRGPQIDNIERVVYSEAWAKKHAEQAGYIAGDGWREQFVYQPDEEDLDDQEAEDEAYAAAELDAFLHKSNEREWVSTPAGVEVAIPPGALCAVMVAPRGNRAEITAALTRLNLGHLPVFDYDRAGVKPEAIQAPLPAPATFELPTPSNSLVR